MGTNLAAQNSVNRKYYYAGKIWGLGLHPLLGKNLYRKWNRQDCAVQTVFHSTIEHHFSVFDISRLWGKGHLCFLYARHCDQSLAADRAVFCIAERKTHHLFIESYPFRRAYGCWRVASYGQSVLLKF